MISGESHFTKKRDWRSLQKNSFHLKRKGVTFNGTIWGPSKQVLLFFSSHIAPGAAQPIRKKVMALSLRHTYSLYSPNNPVSTRPATLGSGHNLVPKVPPSSFVPRGREDKKPWERGLTTHRLEPPLLDSVGGSV